jgi:hypothetical protein
MAFSFYFDHNELQIPPGSYDPAQELVDLLYFNAMTVNGSYYKLGDNT